MDIPRWFTLCCCFGIFVITEISSQYAGGMPSAGSYGGGAAGYGGGGYGSAGAGAGGYGAGGQSSYGSSPGYGSSYGSGYTTGQGSGVYFKKPVPIDEKPIFFRTPYWLPNMYYGHYGYPWTEWFDGGPRYVIPIMNKYPQGGGSTQSYGSGYGTGAGGATGTYGGQSGGSYSSGTDATATDATTTPDPLNDGFSYYKGIPMYQTYYEKYLLQKAQASTAAPA